MTLKKINDIDPRNAEFKEAFNALVEAVAALQKINASPPLNVQNVGGIPNLSVGVDLDEIDVMKLTADMPEGTTTAEAYYMVFDPTAGVSGEYVQEPDNLKEADVACPMQAVHLNGEIHATLVDPAPGKNALLPFTYWHFAILEQDLGVGTANARIYTSNWNASTSEVVTVRNGFLNYGTILNGTRIYIIQDRQSLDWYLLTADCDA
jgi:hypothetical protein